MRKKLDLVGQCFGRLTVLEEAGRDKHWNVFWKCRCSCGTEIVVRGDHLRAERIVSCGCYNRERSSERKTTHGMAKTRLYHIWKGILQRTGVHKGANEQERRCYIDRGITVCEEWLNFENFRDWSLSHEYSDDLEIDRIDNDKGYCPSNCRWVSRKENVNNRRCTIRLEDGTSLAMLCAEIGIPTIEKGERLGSTKESKLHIANTRSTQS